MPLPQFTFTAYLTRGRTEREMEVLVTYKPGADEDAGVEVVDVRVPDWVDDLTSDEYDKITEACEDRVRSDLAEHAAEHADYLYEDYRERIRLRKESGS